MSLNRTILLMDSSPSEDNAPIALQATTASQSEPPTPTEEQRDALEPPVSTRAPPPGPGAASGTQTDMGHDGLPLDHPDGERPPTYGEKRLSMSTSQPEASLEPPGQEFTFLEVSEEGAAFSLLVGLQEACLGALLPPWAHDLYPRGVLQIQGSQCHCRVPGPLSTGTDLSLCPGRTRRSWTAACTAARPAWAASARTGHQPCALPPAPRGTPGSSGTPLVRAWRGGREG